MCAESASRSVYSGDRVFDADAWLSLVQTVAHLPICATIPNIVLVTCNRSGELMENRLDIAQKLYGTPVEQAGVFSIPSVYRGAFFDSGWSHIGALVLLHCNAAVETPDCFYTVFLNPRAAPSSRCELAWFPGALVCRVESDVVRWGGQPGVVSTCPTTTLIHRQEREAAPERRNRLPDGTVIEPDVRDRAFREMNPSWLDDPIVGPALRHLRDYDPDVLAMVAEVDRSLIWDSLRQTPEGRLRRSTQMARILDEARQLTR